MIGRIAGTLAVGAAMLVGGHVAANAAACVNTTISVVTAAAFSCQQQDKIWSNFHFDGSGTDLPGDSTVSFNLVHVGNVDQHTLTIGPPSGGFAQDTTYDLSYTISIAPGTNAVFLAVTAGILFASPGGTADLVKGVTPNVGSPFTLTADGADPSVTGLVNLGTTSINLDDDFFTDTSNVTGFANTFTEVVVTTPEPASLLLLGSGLLGVGLLLRRR